MSIHPLFPNSMSAAVNEFIVNSRETLEKLNQILLDYEDDSSNVDALGHILTCVDCLNAEAESLGHDQLAELSRRCKEVLSLDSQSATHIDQEGLTTLFKAGDVMGTLVEQVAHQRIVPLNLSRIIAELEELEAFVTFSPPCPSYKPSASMLNEANAQLADPDMATIVDAFLIEANTFFTGLNDILSDEAFSQQKAARFKELIPGLNSLRSSAGFLSLEQISTLSKYLKLLLERLSSNQVQWIDSHQKLIRSSFSQLHELILQVKQNKLFPVDCDALISALDLAAKEELSHGQLKELAQSQDSVQYKAVDHNQMEEKSKEENEHEETSFYVGPDHPLYSEGIQEIVESFIVEMGELFDDLDVKLLDLEYNYEDKSLVNDIFRAIHTIKGLAGFLSLDQLIQLAHYFEDVLNQLRKDKLTFHSDILDVMFEAFDAMKVLQKQVVDMKLEVIETRHIVHKLKQISKGTFTGSIADTDTNSPAAFKPVETTGPVTPDQKANSATKRSQDRLNDTIRVEVQRLDSLMNLVGELVLNRNLLAQIITDAGMVLQKNDALYKTMQDTSSKLDFITTELQTSVMQTRMVPVASIFNKFPRVVRDLAKETKKQINFVIEGEETELDKSLIEEIRDPLVHLIRNSVDHGIEAPDVRIENGKEPKGNICLSAQHEGNNIVIRITDDGKGMDPDKLKTKAIEKGLISEKDASEMGDNDAFNLIFQAGFSTAPKVTKISGRGVGMDVVKTNIAKLNGTISIDSNPGSGTVITLKLPLTLTINQSLLVRVKDETFAIPLYSVIEVVNLKKQRIEHVNGQEVIRVREQILPLIHLRDALNITGSKISGNAYAVIVGLAHHRIGLVADRLLGQKEIVIKPLGNYLKKVDGISGSTILGDGHVIMILDIAQIIRMQKTRQGIAGTALEIA